MPPFSIAYISLGSNVGDRRAHLCEALRLIRLIPSKILGSSSLYRTAPVGRKNQGNFYNQVIRIGTALAPGSLLKALLKIESSMGRRRTVRWGPRVIDLDILLYGKKIVKKPGLVIPHSRMHERNFVLIPLCEIKKDLVHPVLKKRIADLVSPEKGAVKRLK